MRAIAVRISLPDPHLSTWSVDGNRGIMSVEVIGHSPLLMYSMESRELASHRLPQRPVLPMKPNDERRSRPALTSTSRCWLVYLSR